MAPSVRVVTPDPLPHNVAVPRPPTTADRVAPSVRQARRVVGLYGDPDVSWSIVLALTLDEAVVEAQLRERLRTMVQAHPNLGAAPAVVRFAEAERAGLLASFANDAYGDADPLLRVALSEDGESLVLAAHHGAIDGLGMLGAASRLLGLPLVSAAKGIPADAEPGSFWLTGLRRLAEALVTPPLRVAAAPQPGNPMGDWLVTHRLDVRSPGSALLVAAAAASVRRWNQVVGRRPGHRRLVIAMGLSRRPGDPSPPPDRDTAYVRLPAGAVVQVSEAREVLRHTTPEAAFPVSDAGGLGPRVSRRLSNRLGSTLLVSNLGLVSGAVREVEFWPVPTGPAGVAVGLASTALSTTLTLRARRAWFCEAEAERLARRLHAEALRLAD